MRLLFGGGMIIWILGHKKQNLRKCGFDWGF